MTPADGELAVKGGGGASAGRVATILAKLVISAALLWLAVRHVDYQALLDKSLAVQPAHLLIALILVLAQAVLLVALRWQAVCRLVGVELPLGTSMRYVAIAQFFNQLLPSSVGGDAVRIWLLARRGPGLGVASRSVILDRAFGVLGLVAFVLSVQPFLFELLGQQPVARWAPLLLGLGCLTGFVVMLGIGLVPTALRRFVPGFIVDLSRDCRHAFLQPRVIAGIMWWSVVIQSLVCLQLFFVMQALGLGSGLADAFVIAPAVTLLLMLPFSIGGWGVREQSMVIGLGAVGIAPGDAVLASVFLGLLGLASGLVCAPAWFFGGRASLDTTARPD